MTTFDEIKEMDFDDLRHKFLNQRTWEILEEGLPELSDIYFWLEEFELPEDHRTYISQQLLEGLTDLSEQNWIVIEDEMVFVDNVQDYGYLPLLELEGRLEYYIAEDHEAAGEANAEYWRDMAENDKSEFVAIIGEETLVDWALGYSAGPGSAYVNSLNEWLELVAEYPEENWAGYDGEEREVNACSQSLQDKLGFNPTVAYRWN